VARLAGKVAFITGAGPGIARAAARLFAAEGARVAIAEIDPATGEDAAQAIGDAAVFVPTDVRDDGSVAAAVAATVARFGGLDILFSCAGGSSADDTDTTRIDLALWAPTHALNLLGPFHCVRHAVPAMRARGGGAIVTMSSWGATRGDHGRHAYAAAKGGLLSLTRAWACDYGPFGIRANAIICGTVKSERWKRRFEDPARTVQPALEANRRAMAERYPFSFGEPEDMAQVALFLASDESRMITGTAIDADGGRSAW
jgi:NAD(P)-dependent dehydrogenase (short-subunit alcohol dehydrogenase family)